MDRLKTVGKTGRCKFFLVADRGAAVTKTVEKVALKMLFFIANTFSIKFG